MSKQIEQNRYLLRIKCDTPEIRKYYESHSTFHEGDSGLDLFIHENETFDNGQTRLVNLGIKCEMIDRERSINTTNTTKYASYYMYARSSISKSNFMLHNGVGIIDSGYRGNLMAALRFVPFEMKQRLRHIIHHEDYYKVLKGQRLVQICAPNLDTFDVEFLTEDEELSKTSRGEGGFGSTGK